MNWKFWKTSDRAGKTGSHIPRSAKPKDLPQVVGRKLVVAMELDPDLVWALKYVSRPLEGQSNVREFRIYNPDKVLGAGVVVKEWASLDDRPDLIFYSGHYDKKTDHVDIRVGA